MGFPVQIRAMAFITMKLTPNQITLSRFFLLILIILSYEIRFFYLGTVLVIIGLLSDFLDGYIARKYKKGTAVGIFLDQFVDKLFVHGLLLYFLARGHLGFLVVLIIILRDDIAVALRYFGIQNQQVMPSIWSGKLKLWLQGVLLLAVSLELMSLIPISAVKILAGITAAWSVISLLHLMYANRTGLKVLVDGLKK